jgi:hypothetical protein
VVHAPERSGTPDTFFQNRARRKPLRERVRRASSGRWESAESARVAGHWQYTQSTTPAPAPTSAEVAGLDIAEGRATGCAGSAGCRIGSAVDDVRRTLARDWRELHSGAGHTHVAASRWLEHENSQGRLRRIARRKPGSAVEEVQSHRKEELTVIAGLIGIGDHGRGHPIDQAMLVTAEGDSFASGQAWPYVFSFRVRDHLAQIGVVDRPELDPFERRAALRNCLAR